MKLLLRRHYPVILVLVFVIVFLVLVLGDQRVIAYTTRLSGTVQSEVKPEGDDYHNDIALFDDTQVHSIQVIMSDEDYDKMLSTYQQTGLKEYFPADVIIDGVRVDGVGIRLKGNASLRTALGGGMGRGMGGDRPGFGNQPQDGQLPGDGQQPQPPTGDQQPGMPGDRPDFSEGFQPPADGENFPGFQPGLGQVSSQEVKIPFLIKFDEYVDGQTYQGYERIAIRTYGTTSDESLLSEPVTNDMFRLVGLPATQTAFTGFRMNDEEERLYVVSEIIDEDYLAKYFENSDGVLYKAEVGSTLSYQGDDPSSYAEDFSQETRLNDADLAPLIAFMRFIDQADDATFEDELPDYLDVDAFASYLALNNLLVNLDSIIGMNNNYYLYYDDVAERFTLLMWDANESLGGMGGGSTANYDLYFTSSSQRFRGPGGVENALLERFMAIDSFKALYEEKLVEIYEKVFLSGAILDDIQRYSTLIHAMNEDRGLVELTRYDQAVQSMIDFINRRMEYLESTDLLGQ